MGQSFVRSTSHAPSCHIIWATWYFHMPLFSFGYHCHIPPSCIPGVTRNFEADPPENVFFRKFELRQASPSSTLLLIEGGLKSGIQMSRDRKH